MELKEAIAVLENDVGQLKFVSKKDSAFMKVIAVIVWVFNRNFMTRYFTVIGTLYPPVGYDRTDDRVLWTLLHEVTHKWDEIKMGKLKYNISYLFPQIMGLSFLLCFLGFLWWPLFFFAVLVLLVAPIPSKPRSTIEARGYAMNILNEAVAIHGLDTVLMMTEESLTPLLLHYADKYYTSIFAAKEYYFMGVGMKNHVTRVMLEHALGILGIGPGADYPAMKLLRSMSSEDWEGLCKAKTFGTLVRKSSSS